jgi:DNA-binding TFAR19-related protein (PDSD5 family)
MSKVLELQITCPQCSNEFEAKGHTLVDAADEADAEVRWELQEGSINMAQCPKCGANGLIPVPVILHEPEREILIAFVPNADAMDESTIGQIIGPMLESFISSVPEERQADYLYQPIVTDDPMALVMAARGESLDDEYEEEGFEDDDEEFDDEDEELTEEELAEIQARQLLLQNMLSLHPSDSLGRIGLMRDNRAIIDDMLVQLIGMVTQQAQSIQPEMVPVLNKITNEIEVFIASN